jgi:DNA-binding transcriptional LysR family regulator
MNIAQLRAFVAVVEEGGFGSAAAALAGPSIRERTP